MTTPSGVASPSNTKADQPPQELLELLQELALAVHKRGIYPASHPMLHGSVDALARRFQSVLSKRSQLSIGVSRHQLVVDGAATDESNASLVDLAERLYEHELGIVTVLATVQRSTLDEFIGAIAVSPARGSAPFGAGGRSQLARWNDLVLTRVAFDRLELMDEGSEAERDDPKTKRSTELWLGLTRAALAGESLDGALEDPARLAESVTRQVNEDGSDAAILGILRQIIGELDDVEIRDSPLRQRVSDLVRNLDDATLSKLLDMRGDRTAESSFLERACDTSRRRRGRTPNAGRGGPGGGPDRRRHASVARQARPGCGLAPRHVARGRPGLEGCDPQDARGLEPDRSQSRGLHRRSRRHCDQRHRAAARHGT
jgi:hypothetical protein